MITIVDEILKAIEHPNVKLLVKFTYSLVFLGIPLLKVLNWVSDLDKKTLDIKIQKAELRLREIELELKELELKKLKDETNN